MELMQAAERLKLLIDGVDPQSGEELPDSVPFTDPRILRCLMTVLRSIDSHTPATTGRAKKSKTRTSSPSVDVLNHGVAWSEQEEQRLRLEFEAGDTIGGIARAHGRTHSGIISRLKRLGLIDRTEDGYMRAGTDIPFPVANADTADNQNR